ncbi:hydroxyjasmonate sulfotransferase [Ranunculus cassubicifolius]
MENSATLVSENTSAKKAATLVAELPRISFRPADIYLWEGTWFTQRFIEQCLDLQSNFKARDNDVILASPMKCGTTWLKALVSTIVHGCNNLVEEEDPLVTKNPHDIVPTLEADFNKTFDHSTMPSPRVLHSHLPFHFLPDPMKSSPCKLIFVARNPKDVFVSMYHFLNTLRTPEQGPYPVNEIFESFCEGVYTFGPYFDHVLGYWNESLKNPKKILFLKYEDLKREPMANVKKLAEFLGKPFRNDEEADQVIWRCSFDRLKNLEVNTKGSPAIFDWKCTSFFRRGAVGDWKNYLAEEMGEKLDQITCSKLAGSGLDIDTI